MALFCAALLAGCAVLPARNPATQRVAAAGKLPASAQQLGVVGASGRLSATARQRVLARLAAEGRNDLLSRHLAVMGEAGDVDLYAGNDVKLLVDGPATFTAMFADIEAARRSVYLESYIVEDQAIATQMADLLIRKRQQGLDVRMIYDSVGSISTSADYFKRLKDQGVPVCSFNPLNPLERPGYWDISHRDHRKILTVDSAMAYTGGINISEVYSAGSGASGGSLKGRKRSSARPPAAAASTPQATLPEATPAGPAASGAASLVVPPAPHDEGWRDNQVHIKGPAAGAFESLVRQTWASQGCEPAMAASAGEPAAPAVAASAPRPPPAGNKVVRVIPASPDDAESRIYAALLSAIDASQRSVHLTMAYFAPGPDMIDALAEAARRGVEVQLVLPSVSDFSPVLHAGRAHYTQLLKAGVRIHELQDALLHAKTAVIDGVVSTVGSSNLDWRSFTANNEVNAVVLGDDFGREMETMFLRDVAASQAITLADWRRRPVDQRLKEWFATLLERWW